MCVQLRRTISQPAATAWLHGRRTRHCFLSVIATSPWHAIMMSDAACANKTSAFSARTLTLTFLKTTHRNGLPTEKERYWWCRMKWRNRDENGHAKWHIYNERSSARGETGLLGRFFDVTPHARRVDVGCVHTRPQRLGVRPRKHIMPRTTAHGQACLVCVFV